MLHSYIVTMISSRTTKKAFCSELVGMALQELNLMKDKAEEESWEIIAEQCLHWYYLSSYGMSNLD